MSVEASAWAWKQIIPANPKYVLIALADWYNELESCAWPSHAKLCEKTGLSRSTVKRSLGWLGDHKLVVPEHRFRDNKQVSNRYRLPVGSLYLQGVQCEPPMGVCVDPVGGLCDLPIEDTLKDTQEDTLNSGEPQETSVNLEEVIGKMSKSKEEIFARFEPKAKKCGDLWRDCRAAAGEHGFQAELTNAHWKMLNNARIRLGAEADFPAIVWKVMHNWDSFCKHAESHAGAFNSPLVPQVAYFVKFIEAAADYAVPVTLIAKPLTNKPASSTPIPKVKKVTEPAITLPELLAMNKDDE